MRAPVPMNVYTRTHKHEILFFFFKCKITITCVYLLSASAIPIKCPSMIGSVLKCRQKNAFSWPSSFDVDRKKSVVPGVLGLDARVPQGVCCFVSSLQVPKG